VSELKLDGGPSSQERLSLGICPLHFTSNKNKASVIQGKQLSIMLRHTRAAFNSSAHDQGQLSMVGSVTTLYSREYSRYADACHEVYHMLIVSMPRILDLDYRRTWGSHVKAAVGVVGMGRPAWSMLTFHTESHGSTEYSVCVLRLRSLFKIRLTTGRQLAVPDSGNED